MNPRARTDRLATSEINNELVLYDLDRHRVHHLNPTAALVWKRCDGNTGVSEIADSLARELGSPVGEDLVASALEQLGRACLLQENPVPSGDSVPLSRRELTRRSGLAGALLMLAPIVTSITAPTAAQAASAWSRNRGKGLGRGNSGGNGKGKGRGKH